MLLVMDVGNTNITLGLFREKELVGQFRMTTNMDRTSDEYGIFICDLIEHKGFTLEKVTDVIIASVVPGIMHSLTSGIIKYLHTTPIIVSAGIKTGLRILAENPKQLGADKIVDAVAAYQMYGGPVIVIDFGTATTFDLINDKADFLAGVIAPGIRTSAKALWGGAAMLPEIEIRKPASILAKETITSMQAGLVYGYIGQTEYIIRKMKEESGYLNAKVVATGGLGKIIAKETKLIDVYDPILTLSGLRLVFEKNKR